MTTINGYKIEDFPFRGLEKISDIKYYDGPIITHFKKNGSDYFSCWVDENKETYRWLIFKVTEIHLFEYLSNKKSLRDLVFAPENDFVYLVDIDDDYRDVFMLFPNDLDEEYIPEQEAFYGVHFPEKYEYLKEKFKEKEIA